MMPTEEASRPEGAYERLIREILAEHFAACDRDGEVVDTGGETVHDWIVDDWTERAAPTPEELYDQLAVAARVLEGFMSVAETINNPLYTALSDCRERVWAAQQDIRESWERGA
jgi:hypothetical protein